MNSDGTTQGNFAIHVPPPRYILVPRRFQSSTCDQGPLARARRWPRPGAPHRVAALTSCGWFLSIQLNYGMGCRWIRSPLGHGSRQDSDGIAHPHVRDLAALDRRVDCRGRYLHPFGDLAYGQLRFGGGVTIANGTWALFRSFPTQGAVLTTRCRPRLGGLPNFYHRQAA